MDPVKVLVADPPWPTPNAGKTGNASAHYPLMSMEQLYSFKLPPLAKDAVLFLWRVTMLPVEALALCDAWGFDIPKHELVWIKTTSHGKLVFGQGKTVRGGHEICLIAKRGKPKVKNIKTRSVLETAFTGERLRHSQKPEEFYKLVEDLYDGPYHELFARRQRTGWTCEGNEL
jgi:N6-adenosine-specific RNA methylase IME4